jgi:putative transposase
MARPYRIQFENALYRAEIRGAEGLSLFAKAADAARFQEILALTVQKHEVLLHAFVLLDNEGDFLVETPKGNLSAFLQGLQTAFAQYYRRAHGHHGPLVRDRFRSKVVDKDALLLEMSAFLHALPAHAASAPRGTAQRVARVSKHPYSSFGAYAGSRDLPFVYTADVLKAMGSPASTRAKRYVDRCVLRATEPHAGLADILDASATAIGGPEFLKSIHDMHAKFQAGRKPGTWKVYGQRAKGLPRTRVLEVTAKAFGVDKEVFFQQRKGLLHRPALSYFLYRHAGMSQFEIATYLRLTSNAAVSLQITRFMAALEKDASLAKLVATVEKALA